MKSHSTKVLWVALCLLFALHENHRERVQREFEGVLDVQKALLELHSAESERVHARIQQLVNMVCYLEGHCADPEENF